TFLGRYLSYSYLKFFQHPLCQKVEVILGLVHKILLSHSRFHAKNFFYDTPFITGIFERISTFLITTCGEIYYYGASFCFIRLLFFHYPFRCAHARAFQQRKCWTTED
ncbi:hypothetical protein ALC60_08618, partial [Trachymyrmex zeteki]